MISTSISSTSDYYSSSDLDYDDQVVKAAPQHHYTNKETNIILQTLLLHHHHHSPSSVSSTSKLQLSVRLLKLVRENDLSNEIFIRANAILHKFLLSTSTNDVDESVLIACLSLATKLTEHSSHFTITLFNSTSLLMNENMICSAVNWDIDVMTPINYVESMLWNVSDYWEKDRLRKLSYEMVVLCITGDIRCMDFSAVSVGMSCLMMACEVLECGEIVQKHVLEYEDQDSVSEASMMYIRQILLNIYRR